jgi:hypothetical protein
MYRRGFRVPVMMIWVSKCLSVHLENVDGVIKLRGSGIDIDRERPRVWECQTYRRTGQLQH